MKYVKLQHDFGVDREKQTNIPSDCELTINWIGTAMDNGFKSAGISSDKRRVRKAILKKLEEAVEAKATVLELNEFEHKFILDAINSGTCSLQESTYVTIAEDALLNATNDKPEELPATSPNQTNVPAEETMNVNPNPETIDNAVPAEEK